MLDFNLYPFSLTIYYPSLDKNDNLGRIPTYVKVICGIVIGGGVIILSIIGFTYGFASDFAVFTFVMLCIYLILMIIGGAMFYQK